MKSSEQLERETEEARARVNHTLDELRARATPGQLVDQLIDYARDTGGAQYFSNLGRQVVDNPLPVALLGLSIAWLAIAGAAPSRRRVGPAIEPELRHARDRAIGIGKRIAGDVRSATDDIADTARSGVDTLADTARSATHAAGETVDSLRGQVAGAYEAAADSAKRAMSSVSETSAEIRRHVVDKSQGFVAVCKDQPIVLAGIGLAIGATLGALLPASEAENRLMGEASDDLKARARGLTEKVKENVENAYEQAKDAATAALTTEPRSPGAGSADPATLAAGHS